MLKRTFSLSPLVLTLLTAVSAHAQLASKTPESGLTSQALTAPSLGLAALSPIALSVDYADDDSVRPRKGLRRISDAQTSLAKMVYSLDYSLGQAWDLGVKGISKHLGRLLPSLPWAPHSLDDASLASAASQSQGLVVQALGWGLSTTGESLTVAAQGVGLGWGAATRFGTIAVLR